jgi:hypothetical protein
MSRLVSRMGFATLAIVAGIAANAQTVTTGGVSGVAKDEKGAPVANATVTFSSGQGNRTTTTAADGSYRLGLLNPGEYNVTVTKEGLQPFKTKVTVLVNQTTTVNPKLAGTTSAVVEVVAAATSVDMTTNQVGQSLSSETLSSIPKGRDMNDLAFLAPGTATSGALGGVSIAGASSLENGFFVDGLSTTDYRKGFQGSAMPTDFVDQVEIQTGGFKPEFSALGGVFNVVTKSGTNNFAGTAWYTYDANQLAAVPKQSQFFRQTPPSDRSDLGATVSGAFIADKLFYFFGVNAIVTEAPQSTPNLIGLVNGKDKTTNLQAYTKINYQVTTDHQLYMTAQINDNKRDNVDAHPFAGDAQWGFKLKDKTTNVGLNWDWTISPALFLSVKAGRTDYKTTVDPTAAGVSRVQDTLWWNATNYPAQYDGLVRTFERGGFGLNEDLNQSTTTQLRADLSWFLGSHNLKIGISKVDADYKLIDTASGPTRIPYSTGLTTPYGPTGYRVVVRRTAGGAFNGIDLVYNGNNSKVKSEVMAFYAQDSWEMFPGFRAAYGFRFESQTLKNNFGQTALKFDDFKDQIQPRLGLTWDINNDGRTKLSANYGRYFLQVPMQPVMRTGNTEVFVRNRYAAANSTYNPTTGAWTVGATPTSITEFGLFFSAPPVADGTKLTQRDEYILGIDQTLPSGWTVGVHAKHRELKNPIEDSVLTDAFGGADETTPGHGDSGGYSILWNPHPGRVTWTAHPLLSSVPGQKIYAEGAYNLFPRAYNVYDSVDLTAEKKTSKYYVNFSYTWSRLFGNYEGVGQSSNGQADALITSTFDYWSYVGDGLLPIDRTHQFKLIASYNMDLGGHTFTTGLKATLISGTPISKLDDGTSTTVVVNGNTGSGLDIGGYGNAVPSDFKYGQFGRTPNTAQVDLTFEYAMQFGRLKVTPNINMFNVFNTRIATSHNIYATDGNATPRPDWNEESNWQRGRNYRFGVKLAF